MSDIRPRLSLTHYAIGAVLFNEEDYTGAIQEFPKAMRCIMFIKQELACYSDKSNKPSKTY